MNPPAPHPHQLTEGGIWWAVAAGRAGVTITPATTADNEPAATNEAPPPPLPPWADTIRGVLPDGTEIIPAKDLAEGALVFNPPLPDGARIIEAAAGSVRVLYEANPEPPRPSSPSVPQNQP